MRKVNNMKQRVGIKKDNFRPWRVKLVTFSVVYRESSHGLSPLILNSLVKYIRYIHIL